MEEQIAAAIAPVLDRVTWPVRYVLATGASLGASQEEMEQMRVALDPVLARNPNLRVSAKVRSNHSKFCARISEPSPTRFASSPRPAATRSAEP